VSKSKEEKTTQRRIVGRLQHVEKSSHQFRYRRRDGNRWPGSVLSWQRRETMGNFLTAVVVGPAILLVGIALLWAPSG
jgi:hypothetical protein